MTKSKVRAILALGWVLSVAAASKEVPKSQAGGDKIEQHIANTFDKVAGALDQANAPKRETVPCRPGADDRQSDLCAQWKAADAAKQAANAADATVFVGWIGLVLAAITMCAAIAAAYFAKKAADHTEAGANQARRASDAAELALKHSQESTQKQLRAYLDLNDPVLERVPAEDAKDCECYAAKVILKNYGVTPAEEMLYRTRLSIGVEVPDWDLISGEEWGGPWVIGQGDHLTGGELISVPLVVKSSIEKEEMFIWLQIEFSYSDVFRKNYHRRFALSCNYELKALYVEQSHDVPVRKRRRKGVSAAAGRK
jgi:hypothetical protein